jgi:uncharacterized integral membrane protein
MALRSLRDAGAWIVRHRLALLRATLLVALLVVILQNVEPIDVDLLFWSLSDVPKLVLILASMALGAAFWEITRRLAGRR